MTKDQLIVKQQLQIQELQKSQEEHKQLKKRLRQMFYNIGGPLNDNNLKFNNDQLYWCVQVVDIINEF